MKTGRVVEANIGLGEIVFRNLLPEDISEDYVDALKSASGRIETIADNIDLSWQKYYVKKILSSPRNTIFGLFLDSKLVGTAGVQNLPIPNTLPQKIATTEGVTYNCSAWKGAGKDVSLGKVLCRV